MTKRLAILYASQTGTAETYAKMLGTYAASHGVVPTVASMNDGVPLLAATPFDCTVFICATCGVGEVPTNGRAFFTAVEKGALNAASLGPCCILGFGNSHNDNFNQAAKRLDQLLHAQKATTRVLPLTLSCELTNGGHEASFRAWKHALWPALGVDASSVSRNFTATYHCTPVTVTDAPVTERHIVRPDFFQTTVAQQRLLTAPGYEPRQHLLAFDVDAATQVRVFGREVDITDHVEIMPVNGSSLVDRALRRLKLHGEQVVRVAPLAGALRTYFADHSLTIRTILAEIVDLSAIPSRSLLEVMSLLAKDESERASLEELANNLAADTAFETLCSGVFSLVDALELFPSVDMGLDQLLTVAPIIAPRTYSLANHRPAGSSRFEILFTVPVRTSTRAGGAPHMGLCSGMLDGLAPGAAITLRFVASASRLATMANNVLYVALGSGIGSIRAAMQRRVAHKASSGHPESVGMSHVFYAFRHADKDCLFAAEFEAMQHELVLWMTPVATRDGGKIFTSLFDRLDHSVVNFLAEHGEIVYCGPGGTVPSLVEAALKRAGVDVATLRASGRYHEEYFTADSDTENLIKTDKAAASATTLAGRVGACDMFCFQCEQTLKGKGCTKVGVCGKTPRVAALQDLTVHAVKVLGFYAHALRALGGDVPAEANHVTLFALFSTLTNVNFDESRFLTILKDVKSATNTVSQLYADACAAAGVRAKRPQCLQLPATLPSAIGSEVTALEDLGKSVGVLSRFTDPATQNAAGVCEMLMYGIKGIAAYADHSLQNKMEDASIYVFLHKALAFMTTPDQFDLAKGLALCIEAGTINVATMGLLYTSHTTLGVPTPTQAPIAPVPGQCILVSGHDLIILKKLLAVTEPLGINVYTHGEMLPAFSYPLLKQHTNLAGHFGGAWMRQAIEFPHVPGPLLMTPTGLTEPAEAYAARLFTAGAVGWTNIPHLGNTPDDIDFGALVAAAQQAPGFDASATRFTYEDPQGIPRPAAYTVGFGHETIISVAPTLISEIQAGNISRFFVVGGCDGFEGDRSYYTELVTNLPPTAVVLTVGCGKFRINHLNRGTIGATGIPRILDMGQCNDSFSAVQVALALAGALQCKVSDLPLSIVLSWFEQKAVAVLLSCIALGLKPIHIGPALPAFVTPDVLGVLVKDFGLLPLGNPAEDAKAMCAATGAS
jgi:hydroxylamine reductase